MTLAMSGVAPEDSGLASGLVNTTQQVGGAFGIAILATVAADKTGASTSATALVDGYQAAFTLAAGADGRGVRGRGGRVAARAGPGVRGRGGGRCGVTAAARRAPRRAPGAPGGRGELGAAPPANCERIASRPSRRPLRGGLRRS